MNNEHNPEWLVEWLNDHLCQTADTVMLQMPLRDDMGETEDDDEWFNEWINQQVEANEQT